MSIIKDVVMGSGNLFAMPCKDIEDVFNLTTEEETELANLGYIESNAALTASVEEVETKAANAGTILKFTKEKNLSFKTGIMSWDLGHVAKFLTGSDYTVDEETGRATYSYDFEDQAPDVYLRFISEDLVNKKRIIINMFQCSFSGELAFDFNNDKPITFDYSFKILSKASSDRKKHKYYEVHLEDIA